MAKTKESDRCKQYIIQSLTASRTNLERCHTKLNVQARSWISTLPRLDILDNNLKQFVHLQNKHLSERINRQLSQYKSILEEQKLFQQILLYLTSNDRVCYQQKLSHTMILYAFSSTSDAYR